MKKFLTVTYFVLTILVVLAFSLFTAFNWKTVQPIIGGYFGQAESETPGEDEKPGDNPGGNTPGGDENPDDNPGDEPENSKFIVGQLGDYEAYFETDKNGNIVSNLIVGSTDIGVDMFLNQSTNGLQVNNNQGNSIVIYGPDATSVNTYIVACFLQYGSFSYINESVSYIKSVEENSQGIKFLTPESYDYNIYFSYETLEMLHESKIQTLTHEFGTVGGQSVYCEIDEEGTILSMLYRNDNGNQIDLGGMDMFVDKNIADVQSNLNQDNAVIIYGKGQSDLCWIVFVIDNGSEIVSGYSTPYDVVDVEEDEQGIMFITGEQDERNFYFNYETLEMTTQEKNTFEQIIEAVRNGTKTTLTYDDFEGVTDIPSNAFEDCTALTSVEIPNTITSIGSYAFNRCTGLTSLTFQENSTLTEINTGAFSSCSNLTTLRIPASVTGIYISTFGGCSNLSEVIFEEGSQLQKLGASAFSGTKITEITLPSNLSTFQGLDNNEYLQTVTFTSDLVLHGNLNTWSTFRDCPALTIIYVPSAALEEFKTTLSEYADLFVGV